VGGEWEQKERNRMSAQRSRQRKRQQSDSLQAESDGVRRGSSVTAVRCSQCSEVQVRRENGRLAAENLELREEVAALRVELGRHRDCRLAR
jgi:hypothetical protein